MMLLSMALLTARTARAKSFSTSAVRTARLAPIKITERAAARIKDMLASKDDADVLGVKVSVKKRGCNGYSYQMNYATSDDLDKKKNEVVDAHGVRVFVDTKAIFFIVGTTMDYSETDIAAEFTFTNPNSKGACGCGESFNV